ncbi:hypothetical protein HYPSUDRAFT_208345 [Hypholoma sublateritium FD-334 SS-4]|uniref:Uncharacterized protein n=1 Tax=Hypholoma sublateritium (strain FD-334 SS-4) TaxID=945553 RepID=A0A0D2LVK0_HYPSF|nr:hypothetical protein HYPSUDRAFT_208345 [Hypholoma sublateritium FD-334 SS-4]
MHKNRKILMAAAMLARPLSVDHDDDERRPPQEPLQRRHNEAQKPIVVALAPRRRLALPQTPAGSNIASLSRTPPTPGGGTSIAGRSAGQKYAHRASLLASPAFYGALYAPIRGSAAPSFQLGLAPVVPTLLV